MRNRFLNKTDVAGDSSNAGRLYRFSWGLPLFICVTVEGVYRFTIWCVIGEIWGTLYKLVGANI